MTGPSAHGAKPPALSAPASRYVTDPPSARAQGGLILPVSVFDTARLMDAIRRGLIEGLPPLDDPTDEQLIATAIAHGMPRWSADQMRYNPSLRLRYYMFWLDVRGAAGGDPECKERVDAAISAWQEMRRVELISEIPNHTVGLWER